MGAGWTACSAAEGRQAVTPLGQLPFFIDDLKQAGLSDPFVADCPLDYTSLNAPAKRDLLGTLVLGLLTGAKRYAHMTALRNDSVNPALLGMKSVCSDDSVRRGLKALDSDQATTWLQPHLDYVVRPLMSERWILDVDSRVKPIYTAIKKARRLATLQRTCNRLPEAI